MAYLVVDSGSTKSDWVMLNHGQVEKRTGPGISPTLHNLAELRLRVGEVFPPEELNNQIDAIYFYGTGCKNDLRRQRVQETLQVTFPKASLHVEDDLTGAARATCGHDKGIACILGTGSNSGVYDGRGISWQVTNLGYLLGDEGSGFHMGGQLVRAYFYKDLPQKLSDKIAPFMPGSREELLENMYGKVSPNRYLASFVPVLLEHIDHKSLVALVKRCLGEFLDRNVKKYAECKEYPVHFVGSIAYHFRPQLEEVMAKRQLTLGNIVRRPIEALVLYHQS